MGPKARFLFLCPTITKHFWSFSAGQSELEDICRFEEEILRPEKFEQVFQIDYSLKNPWMEKIYRMVQKLGKVANVVTLIDTHAFTDVVLSEFSSRACPASQETALTPAFTGGELPLN